MADASKKSQELSIDSNGSSRDFRKKKISKAEAGDIDTSREYNGVCQWYNDEKGYGFLSADQGRLPCDVWVHAHNIASHDAPKLQSGQRCTFRVQIKVSPKTDSVLVSAADVVPGEPKGETELRGICLRFDRKKRYGFLKALDSDMDKIFVHQDSIRWGAPLCEGQGAKFVLRQTQGRSKAVRVIPEKFEETPMSQTIRKGVVTAFYEERAFGFLREDGQAESHFFHIENVLGRKALVEDQEVRFRLRHKIGFKTPDKIEAFEVNPGAVRHKEVFNGTFKKLREKERFGIIQRRDSFGVLKNYCFDYDDVVRGERGDLPNIEVGQLCTFTPKMDRKNRFRAVYITPAEKIHQDSEYIGFEPYLQSHYDMIEKLKKRATLKREKNGSSNAKKTHSKEKKRSKTVTSIQKVKNSVSNPQDLIGEKPEALAPVPKKVVEEKAKPQKYCSESPGTKPPAVQTQSESEGDSKKSELVNKRLFERKEYLEKPKKRKTARRRRENRKNAEKVSGLPRRIEMCSEFESVGLFAKIFRWIRGLCKVR